MKIFLTVLTVFLDLLHAADGATNDTTAVKPSRPPLIVAVERGDRRAVEKLLRDGADVEVRTSDGVTPLYAAAFHDQADILQLLIRAGAKVDGRAAHGRTALFPAGAEGRGNALDVLLDAGADPNARSDPGELAQTPLHMAAVEGQVETTRRLLTRGARANVWDDRLHITPLYLAVLAGHERAAALLRERGADPAITDVFGQTPARAAALMAGAKTRQLLSATNISLGFDSRSIVVLAYLGESQERRTYRGNRVAVAFGDGSLIATAAHCVDDFAEAQQKAILAKPLVFSPYHGDLFEAEILAVDASADLAILRVAWDEHPAVPLADDQELEGAKEMFVTGYAPPENKDGTRLPAPRQLSAEQLPVVQVTVSNGAPRVILGGARFTGPGWSGSPMILTGSGSLGGIFCRKDDVHLDALPVLRNRIGASARAIRELMSAQGIQMKAPPRGWKGPDDAAAAFSAGLGWLDSQAGRPPQDALAAGERFVQRRPNSGQAHRLLAVSASAMRSPGAGELADTHFREAARLAPGSVLVHASYGWHLDTRGRTEEALAELDKAARIEPENAFVRATRLKLLADLRPNEAELLGQRLVAEGSDIAAYWFHYAGALRKLGKHGEALRAAQAAVRLASKEQVWYRGRLADILARCGQLEEAEECHRELLEQRPDSPTFWLWYAQFLVEKRPERSTDARRALQKCESLNDPPIVPPKVLDDLRVQCQPNTGPRHEP